jgi:hypothetical protein
MNDVQHSTRSPQGIIRRRKTTPVPDEAMDKGSDILKRLDRLIDELRNASLEKHTGYIKVNITQGDIGRVEKFEEILKK